MLHAIVMAGGAGTRFWPASRKSRPKQLLKLAGQRTMIQETLDRLRGLVPESRTLVITNRELVSAIAALLPQLPPQSILGEPCKRDTAPCIGLAAALVSREDQDATLLVTPADHLIETHEQYHAAVQQACRLVDEDPRCLVTFGIRPTYPAESFGYIERGELLSTGRQAADLAPIYGVRMFREKPTAEVAEQYLSSGGFYWNSGIFVWKARTILEALHAFEPDLYQRVGTIARAAASDAFSRTLGVEFSQIRGKSIDYAVMERYDRVAVIEAPFRWDDVGSWRSLARLLAADQHGNTIQGRHLGLNTRNCIVRGADNHLIVTVGMQDCIVVHTPDATLVARTEDEESIRQVVRIIAERGWEEYL